MEREKRPLALGLGEVAFVCGSNLPMNGRLSAGHTYPLGATIRPGGVNFCIFSKNCTALELLLFERVEDALPARVIHLDPRRNRTFYYWHVFVPGISAGQLYAYRAHGRYVPELGRRYDGEKVLLDPYARAVAYGANYSREAASRPGDNCAQSLKGVVVDARAYDWEGDAPLQRPWAGAVWYELHVGGFSRHASSSVAPERRGTYAGLIDKIPYLKELGVSAVELLPVQQFDEQAVPPPRKEYWGYNPIAFFAPHHGYSAPIRITQTANGTATRITCTSRWRPYRDSVAISLPASRLLAPRTWHGQDQPRHLVRLVHLDEVPSTRDEE